MEIFIGRQPIFNANEEIVAYELLYRSNHNTNSYKGKDSDAATIDVIVNSFLSIGISEVTKGLPGFVNFTESLMMKPVIELLNPANVVIEILEDVPITHQLIKRVIELKKIGFTIALDDFVLDKKVELYDQLFAHTDIIKVDFLLSKLSERMEIENKVKSSFPHIRLLAEKVETRNHYDVAKQSGYTLFQGYFFEQPQIIKTTDIPLNTLQYFQVMNLLNDAEPNINGIADSIEKDIALTYKLLQMVNNSTFRTKSKVRSIKQAIMLLGLTELRKYLYLLALREGGITVDSDVYKVLMRTSLFRAKVCEKLAKLQYRANFSEYFLIGMFSLVDTILKRPMEEIIQRLPFSKKVAETICGVETEMTPFLKFSIALCKHDWDSIDLLAPEFRLSHDEVKVIYNESMEWAENAL